MMYKTLGIINVSYPSGCRGHTITIITIQKRLFSKILIGRVFPVVVLVE